MGIGIAVSILKENVNRYNLTQMQLNRFNCSSDCKQLVKSKCVLIILFSQSTKAIHFNGTNYSNLSTHIFNPKSEHGEP